MNRFAGDEELDSLIKIARYEEAEAYCAARPEDRWLLLRSATCFLNDTDSEAYSVRGPSILERYVKRHPEDVDARFLRAYWTILSTEWTEPMDLELLEIARRPQPHPYANLSLAAFRTYPVSGFYLRRTLSVQPNNLRAIFQLGREELVAGVDTKGIDHLRGVLHASAFVETSWGILNGYANEVWTGAAHERQVRTRAEAELARGGFR